MPQLVRSYDNLRYRALSVEELALMLRFPEPQVRKASSGYFITICGHWLCCVCYLYPYVSIVLDVLCIGLVRARGYQRYILIRT
ncbi:hypothetical protein EXIGLDRAFT_173171 [Exidia glandulosa HHB12029]|uniref:Uncharacterized protein n=1 Tax=Exidia glandulosa HHB12029 TaxID=1314781 RepID=A0A165F9X9_EXIGL|nr:hypothetical protein EXIGLDRAFT_173171 [Exidia glandulosa HHB12029]